LSQAPPALDMVIAKERPVMRAPAGMTAATPKAEVARMEPAYASYRSAQA